MSTIAFLSTSSLWSLFLLLLLFPKFIFSQRRPFRTDLFNEQNQQAALMVEQSKIHLQMQDIQRRLQAATENSLRETLIRQQDALTRRLQEMVMEQQRLQLQLQEQLIAGSRIGNSAPTSTTTQFRIINTASTPQRPVQQQTQVFQNSFQQQTQQQFQQSTVQQGFQQTFQQTRPTQTPVTQQPVQLTNQNGLSCSTLSGGAGECRPLVNCLSFYAELPDLKRQPCRLGRDQLGVCCPLRSRPGMLYFFFTYVNI